MFKWIFMDFHDTLDFYRIIFGNSGSLTAHAFENKVLRLFNECSRGREKSGRVNISKSFSEQCQRNEQRYFGLFLKTIFNNQQEASI